jgi:exodeoxyribonuclease VII large subunit
MFRRSAATLKFTPKHGDEVVVKASVKVYPVRGNYQLLVSEMSLGGVGDLHRQFLRLKEKLDKEGLFDPSHKKSPLKFPHTNRRLLTLYDSRR